MTEAERYLALGLTPPESTGANEQEVADPADEGAEPELESGNNPEVADPEEDPDMEPDEDPEGEGGNEREVADPVPNTEEKPAQDRATNARNAARRREAEMLQKLEAARKEERERYEARMKRALERAGFKDGETPIVDLDGLESYLDKSEQAKLSRDLSQGKLTPEALQDMVQRSVEKAVSAAAPQQTQPVNGQRPVQQQRPAQPRRTTAAGEELKKIAVPDSAMQMCMIMEELAKK